MRCAETRTPGIILSLGLLSVSQRVQLTAPQITFRSAKLYSSPDPCRGPGGREASWLCASARETVMVLKKMDVFGAYKLTYFLFACCSTWGSNAGKTPVVQPAFQLFNLRTSAGMEQLV